MKNAKVKLSELKVSSFVTKIETEAENTVKGGRATFACTLQCGSGGPLASTDPACYDK